MAWASNEAANSSDGKEIANEIAKRHKKGRCFIESHVGDDFGVDAHIVL